MTEVLIKRRNLETLIHTGRVPSEEEGRDWSDASSSQELAKIVSKPPEAKRGKEQILPYIPQEKRTLNNTLISDFQSSEL